MSENKPKHPGGRPTKYKPEYCQKIVEWFSQPVVKEIVETVEGKNWTKDSVRYEPVFFPTFELFAAIELGVDTDTIVEWSKVYPEFSAAYTRAKAIQKGVLLQFASLGKLNSQFSQFMAINNMGMVSKSEVKNETEITHKYEDMTDEQLDAIIADRKDRAA